MLLSVLITLLRLTISEILPQLVIAATTFKSFKQILAIHILNDGSLANVGETLKDATRADTPIFIDIYNGIALAYVASLDPCSLFSTWLFAWNIGLIHRFNLDTTVIVNLVWFFAHDMVEIGLLLRYHVQIAD